MLHKDPADGSPKLLIWALRMLVDRFETQANCSPDEWLKTPKDAHRTAYRDCARQLSQLIAAASND